MHATLNRTKQPRSSRTVVTKIEAPQVCRKKLAHVVAEFGSCVITFGINPYSAGYLEAGNPTKPFSFKTHTLSDVSHPARGLILAKDLTQREKKFIQQSDYCISPLVLSSEEVISIYKPDVYYDKSLNLFKGKGVLRSKVKFKFIGENKVMVCDFEGQPIEVLALRDQSSTQYVTCDVDLFLIAARWEDYKETTDIPFKASYQRGQNGRKRQWDLRDQEDFWVGNVSSHTRSLLDLEGMKLFQHNSAHHNPFAEEEIEFKLMAFVPLPQQSMLGHSPLETYTVRGKSVLVYTINSQEELSQFIINFRRDFAFMLNPNWAGFCAFHKKKKPKHDELGRVIENKFRLEQHKVKEPIGRRIVKWSSLTRPHVIRTRTLMQLILLLDKCSRAKHWLFWLVAVQYGPKSYEKKRVFIPFRFFSALIHECQMLSPKLLHSSAALTNILHANRKQNCHRQLLPPIPDVMALTMRRLGLPASQSIFFDTVKLRQSKYLQPIQKF